MLTQRHALLLLLLHRTTHRFQADVSRVMDIIINSLYSDRDIFLRELVSNAADACDKKKFLSYTSDETLPDPEIRIKCDEADNTITIEDSGVGMTRDELVNNLGRIAQSGTKAFLEALGDNANDDVSLIGQFGVGFYSAYLVADKVEVVSKSMQAGSPQLRWSSEAGSSFTITEDDSEPIEGSGSRLILHLKEDASDYLDAEKIEELLQRYSEFIEFPISLFKEKTEYKTVPDEEANKELKEGEEPKTKTVPETTTAYEQLNNQKPLWLRRPAEVDHEEYMSFYKSAFRNRYDTPMKYTHFVLEGQVLCKAILYIPGMLPYDLSKDMFDENARNIRLYVKRVFINDKFEGLMPRWLKFVSGVVDSDDLPLNVSREILQKSRVLNVINKRLVRKSLDMIREIAGEEDSPSYVMFWNNFGKYLKVGVIEDDKNREELKPLLRFFSSKSGEEYTSLDEYVERMPEDQKNIYFVTGENREKASMSPVIEKLKSRGYEVLFAVEPLDEIMFENLQDFKDIKVVDVSKETSNLEETVSDEDKKKKEEMDEALSETKEYLSTVLGGKIQKVTVSTLLTDSPAALVQGAYGMSPTMQRYMRAQTVASGGDVSSMAGANQVVLEINPNHPIVRELNGRILAGKKEEKETEDYALLMYDVASMTSGYEVGDIANFAKRVMGMMTDEELPSSSSNEDTTDTEEATETEAEDEDDNDGEAVEAEVLQ